MAVTFVGAVSALRQSATVDATPDFSGVSWADGDFAVAFLDSDASTNDFFNTVPTGWAPRPGAAANYGTDALTGSADTTADPGRCWCYTNFLATGEDTTPTWVWNAHEDGEVHILIFRGVDPTTPIPTGGFAFTDSASATSHVAGPVDATTDGGALVSCAFADAASVSLADPWTPPGTMTQAAENGEATSGTYTTSAYETFATALGTGINRTWTLNTTADIGGMYLLVLNPAAGGGGGRDPALNTGASVEVGQVVRVRFEVQETAGTATSLALIARFSKNGGAYQDMTTTSDLRAAASSQFADGDATTDLLPSGTGTFVAGQGKETNTATAAISFPAAGHTEDERCLVVANGAVGDTFDIRIYRSTGTALDAYANTPRLTVTAPPSPPAIGVSPATLTFNWTLP